MIKGRLSETSLPTLLIVLLRLRKTGRLTIHHQAKGYSLYFEDGKLQYMTSLWAKDGLARIIEERQLIAASELEHMLSQESVKPLEEQLFQSQKLTNPQISELMDMNAAMTLRVIDLLMQGEFVFLPGRAAFPFSQKKNSVVSMIITKSRQLTNLDAILPLLEPLDAVPELDREAPGFQTLVKIKLTAQEGFILSRIDGFLDFNKIFAFCGREHVETARFLLLLSLFDVIKYNKGAQYVRSSIQKQQDHLMDLFKQTKTEPKKTHESVPEETGTQKTDDDKDDAFSEAARESDEKIVSEIKDMLAQCPNLTYYQILGINRDASSAQIKTAYFQLAKKYHPDNFYRRLNKRDLANIENLFDYIKKAYDVLNDDSSRREYNSKLYKGVSASPVDQADLEAKKKISADYQYKQALACIKSNDLTRALDFLKAAQEFDPDNALVLAKHAEIEFRLGHSLTNAEKMMKHAIELKDNDGLLHLLFAKILLKRRRLDEAEREVKRALLLEPENLEVRKTMQEIKQERQKNASNGKKGLLGKLFKS
ncbi:DnaJ domain-containing protein [bacterium]|nr:DnaJ domain-containing protein [bacterium]